MVSIRLIPATVLLFTSAVFGAKVQLPQLSGDFSVGTVAFPLTDESRDDPLATSPHKRALMMSLFYPTTKDAASKYPPAPYGPAQSLALINQVLGLPNGTSLTEIVTRCSEGSPINHNSQKPSSRVTPGCNRKLPLVFFSPGFAGVRLAYGHIAADLASNGYIVASIDSTFEAPVVEFPDGTIDLANPDVSASGPNGEGAAWTNLLGRVQDVRVADIEFVKKTLLSDGFKVPGMAGDAKLHIDTNKIGSFGHSLGGSTSAAVMLKDKSIKAGLNMDGSFFGNLNSSSTNDNLKRPFMVFQAYTPVHNRNDDASYAKFFDEQKEIKTIVATVKGTDHLSYTDIPVILEALSVDKNVISPDFKPGDLPGERMNLVLSAYIRAFFNKNLKCQDDGLLSKKTDKAFPEVTLGDS